MRLNGGVRMKTRKWSIRILILLQIVCFLSIDWDRLRVVMFPAGTRPTDALIFLLLVFILEEILRIKTHLNAE